MSGLKFGTSGVRGLVVDFTEEECHAFVTAFVESVQDRGFRTVLMAGDLRESTPSILSMVARSFQANGYRVIHGGFVPTPALAWGCSELGLPGVMVTGSHIPADRNGLKFYFPEGEILKKDEDVILSHYRKVKGKSLSVMEGAPVPEPVDLASRFRERYTRWLGAGVLSGLRVGYYSHSSVARDIYPAVFRDLGAEVHEFGRSDVFIPVDTEAVESVDFLHRILREEKLDLVVSTDGDSDRPLVVCEDARVVPGEVLGMIASRHLGMDSVVFPVSCSSALVDSGMIAECHITRIGSPFVLEKMLQCLGADSAKKTAGFEANGGYILGSAVGNLKPLMTRDSLLPLLAYMVTMKERGVERASDLLSPFSGVFNVSGLVRDFEPARARAALEAFASELEKNVCFESLSGLGNCISKNELDGIRARFSSGATVHLRPSGNAPEFRLYIEAESRTSALRVLAFFEDWLRAL